ncbi:ATPase, T2SS/T4P/T4SS family [Peptococcaceae bacterium 1198_IL3148]
MSKDSLEMSNQDWDSIVDVQKTDIVEELASQIYKEHPDLFNGDKVALGESINVDYLEQIIRQTVLTRKDLLPDEIEEITGKILGQATGYGQLSEFFTGPEAEEITETMINPSKDGPKVFVGKHGRPHYVGNHYFKNDQEVKDFVQLHCDKAGRSFTAESPVVDAWLPDGSRLAAMGYKACPLGTMITIRKSPVLRPPLPLSVMVANGTMPQLFSDIAKDLLVPGQCNIGVFGRTDSGKTTLLRALGLFIDPMDRTMIGETSFELFMPNLENCINVVTVKIGGNEILSMGDICDSFNRNNPDRTIVSEIRAGEVVAAAEIAESTSGGFWTTAHCGSVNQLRSRLPKMFARGGMTLPRELVDDQIRSMFNYLIFVDKDSMKKRTLMELVQVTDDDYRPIIRFDKEEYALTRGKTRRWIYENPISNKGLADLGFRGGTIKPEYEKVIGNGYLYAADQGGVQC